MPKIKRHYVARVVVTRVDKQVLETSQYNNQTRAPEKVETEGNRETSEIASIVFTAADPTELSSKIAAHIALITDGEADAGA